MRSTFVAVSLCLMAAVSPRCLRSQTPDTVADRDLEIARLPAQPDTSAVRRVLGTPQHTSVADQPNEDGVLLTRWMYRGFIVSFDGRGAFYTMDISAADYPTSRGVRVGDALAKVRGAYGQPAFEDADHLLYPRSNTDVETRGIAFFFDAGILRRIMIGNVISR